MADRQKRNRKKRGEQNPPAQEQQHQDVQQRHQEELAHGTQHPPKVQPGGPNPNAGRMRPQK